MSNKTSIILLVLIAGIFAFLYLHKKPKTREEMIDYLNTKLGSTPVWVKMSDEELKDVYTFARLYKEEGIKITEMKPELKTKLEGISKKYNIFT